MRSLMSELKERAGFFLLAMLLMASFGARDAMAQWFTSPGGGGGGFTGRPLITVELYVDNNQTKATVPVNLAGVGPNPSLPYTRTLTAVVRQDGRLYPASQINFDLAPSLAQGALYDPADLTKGYRAFPVEKSSGIATMFFHASSTPGDVVITASAQDPSTKQTVSASIKITVVDEKRPAVALTFSGPYVNAVIAGESRFGNKDDTLIKDGTYSRVISVVVNDHNGNPTNPNTKVDFYLVDAPLTGYPNHPGAFFTAGANGDPLEGKFTFKALNPPGNFISKVVRPYERLILDGRQNNNEPLPNNFFQTGIWSVKNILSETDLTIVETPAGRPFNQGDNNGATVPYIIGRAENGAVLSPAYTNIAGVASTVLTYPVERIGQTAVVVACVAETGACGILNTCDRSGANCKSAYLGITNGTDRTLTVSATSLKPNSSTEVRMCLRDANFTPLPATEIRYDIGAKGPAKVTVNGKEGTPGKVVTGANGCVTVPIASSGQLPGSLSIPLLFTSDYVPEAVTITIRAPGAGKLEGMFNCKNKPEEGTGTCEGMLRLTDDEGSPLPGVLIGLGGVSAPGEFVLTFDPAEGVFGKTNDNGQVQVKIEMKSPGDYSFPFQTVPSSGATYTLEVGVTPPGTLKVTMVGETDAKVGVPYSASLLAEGGVPPYAWKLVNGSLPPGISLGANGSISGTPTQDGSFSFAVQVKDKNGLTGMGAFTINVGKAEVPEPLPSLTVELAPLTGTVNVPFNGTASAAGGKDPYTFTILSGTLPTGLSMSSNGTISGTPSAVGTFAFSIKASDSKGATGTGNFLITIASASPIALKLEGGGKGKLGVPFTDGTVSASGGVAPYTFSEIGQVLSFAGLKLGSDGAISGTPVQVGDFTFTVEATDKNGLKGRGSLTIKIEDGSSGKELTVKMEALKATAGTPFSALVGTVTGGKPPYTWSLESRGNLPNGITLSKDGVLAGTFSSDGTYNFVVKVADSSSPAQTAIANATVIVGAGTGGVSADQLVLLASSPDLPSSGQNPVTLTAIARDKGGVLLKDVVVNFMLTKGDASIQITRATTDETGTAQAILSTGGNQHNRSVTVQASAGSITSNEVTVNVIGTTLNVSGIDAGAAVLVDDTRTLIFELKDSSGQAIAGQTLNITSVLNGLSLPPATSSSNGSSLQVKTNSSGIAEVNLTINQNGRDTINATWDAAGAATSSTLPLTLNASPDAFTITVTDNQTKKEDDIGISPGSFGIVVVEWLNDGQPVVGGTVKLVTTKGQFSPADVGSGGTTFTGVTDAAGQVTVNVQSTVPGDAVITATGKKGGDTVSAQKLIHFVATNPQTMTLQAQPATIAVNVPPSTSSQSTITATLRDPNENPVANKDVVFSILQDTSGGTLSQSIRTTNFSGQASVTYTAGSVSTQEKGVRIQATVPGTSPPVSAVVELTVSKREVFITLGTGNTVTEPDPTTYSLPYNVLVNDIVGGPVVGATVVLDTVPMSYRKGQYYWGVVTWVPMVTAICDNEDKNGNGILDPGEDTNGNGVLDPGNVVTTSVPSVTTGNDGFAKFEVLYAQQYANWIDNRLSARTKVGGSEDVEHSLFVLPASAEDLSNEKQSPPGQPSPFGVLPSCAISTQAEKGLTIYADPNPLAIDVGGSSLGPTASKEGETTVRVQLAGSADLTGAVVLATTSSAYSILSIRTPFSSTVSGLDAAFKVTVTNTSLTQSFPIAPGSDGTQIGTLTFRIGMATIVVPVRLRQ